MATKGFTAITSEGGLLPTDFLAELADSKSDIDGLDPVTYRLAPGERVGDQVNRSWNRLKGCWTNFQRSIVAKQSGEPTTTETRERWLLPLFHELDFGRLAVAKAIEIDGKSYSVSHGWASVPVHLVGSHVDLDRRTPGAVGAARMSPHSLVQQVLNASEDRMWGIISNGFMLRLLRDNVTLTRMAYVEWDLQAIFDGDLYPEFFLLWLVCHQSRFEAPPGGRPDQCWLEKWKKEAEDKGLRALENLRPGVEKAIAELGSGLVSHKANQALRSKLSKGQLTTQDFYRQILRIIYRMLFLFVAEDRGLLHPPLPKDEEKKEVIEAALKARGRYRDFYSIGRLRDLTIHRAGTPHPDLWQVFQLISGYLGSDSGCPGLALPALGSFLWSQESTSDLNGCFVSNRHFLQAVHSLAYVRDGNVRRTIDYKNLGAEELGSVYESLLELHPIVNVDIGTFELKTAAGHERKTTGSYYTDDSLVQSLLDTALEPVIAESIKGKEGQAAAEALLNLKFCDPAVGSGHFLIAAGHRLAKRVAIARTGEEEPSPEATRSALRDVIGHCLYGVDVNPMAAELCRVSLWLEALEPGKPLSFLDHHVQVGNSLLGATPELIATGLPDDAFTPIEGDDKKVCSTLKKRNRQEREGQQDMLHMMVAESKAEYNSIEERTRGIDRAPDDTIDQIHLKADQFNRLVVSPEYQHALQIADAWCSAFVWRKQKGTPFAPITTDTIRRLEEDRDALTPGQKAEVEHLSGQYQFFHWHLAFPEVFAKGGFDCVFGNPPWELTQLQEKEWFDDRRPDIANAPTGAERKRMIEVLKKDAPDLYAAFSDALRKHDGMSHFLGNSGRYPLCGRGRINLYAVFAEDMRNLLSDRGRIGCVLPTGIATDDTTKFFFQDVVEKKSLASLYDFENKKGLFPAVHAEQKFCLFTSGRGLRPITHFAEFAFFAHAVEDLREPQCRFTLSAEDIALLNPNTRTCPIFRSCKDAEFTKAVYRRVPVLIREAQGRSSEENPWGIKFKQGLFNMTSDSQLFRTREQLEADAWRLQGNIFRKGGDSYLPLFEGKLTGIFDHRAGTFEEVPQVAVAKGNERESSATEKCQPSLSACPRYWVKEREVLDSYGDTCKHFWLTFHDIANPNNERTFIATLIPGVAVGNTLGICLFDPIVSADLELDLSANLNSFVLDYVSRLKISSRHFNFFIVRQLPVLPTSTYSRANPWTCDGQNISGWLLPRAVELTFTAWDLDPFAKDCNWFGPPFRWDEERRFLLRCELDAAFFHLYLPAAADGQWKPARVAEGAVRDETPEELAELKKHFPTPRHAVEYIMDTFPIVKRRDEEKHGEYRTKRVILEIYDELSEAIKTGRPHKTRLTPPPGPPTDGQGNFLPLPEWKPGQPKPASWPPHIHLPKEVSNGK